MSRARVQRHVLRACGAALALLTFASPLLESLHEASVRHVACPEDGELIDAPPQAAHQHAQATSDGLSLFAEQDPSAPRSRGGEHNHCAIALRAHLRAREQKRAQVAVDVAELVTPPSVPQDSPRLYSLAVYRIAPKASPPA